MKKRAIILSAILMSLLIVGGILSYKFELGQNSNIRGVQTLISGNDEDTKAEVNIKAPDRVRVGDLIIIDLSESLGAGFDYKVMPKPPGLRIFDDGRTIVCGTGDKNTEYLFIVSCALDGDSDIQTHIIKVYGASKPGPSPNPGENVIGKVKDWCDSVTSPTQRDDAIRLAQSFASVAVIIEQDTFGSAADLIEATATSNRGALGDNLSHWTPLLDSLMKELKLMAEVGKLPDIKAHAQVWKDVASGLRAYAESISQ